MEDREKEREFELTRLENQDKQRDKDREIARQEREIELKKFEEREIKTESMKSRKQSGLW